MRKNCDNCNFSFDNRIEFCPKCSTKNNGFEKTSIKNPLFFLDIIRSLIILAVYIVTSYILPTIVSLIVQSVNPEIINDSLFVLSLQFGITMIAIGGFIVILWNYKSIIFNSFKKWQNYVFGIVIGIAIFGLSFLVNYFLPLENSNQLVVENMVKSYPVFAFFTVVIFGPISEEVIYRVCLMSFGSKITKKYTRLISYIISCVLFVLVHLNFIGENVNLIAEISAVPGYLIGALGLAFAYDYFGFTGSTIAHIVNNLISFIIIVAM